jgi:hypothetical protein
MKRTTASLLYAALLLGTGVAALDVVTGRFAAPPAGAGPTGADGASGPAGIVRISLSRAGRPVARGEGVAGADQRP